MMTDRERYQHYLRCDCWMKVIRAAAMTRANRICEVRMRCNGARATDGHHNSYASIGNEGPFDVIAVCRACHRALHGLPEPAANDNAPVSNAQLALDLFGKTA